MRLALLRRTVVLACTLAALTVALPAMATVQVLLSRTELIARADLVVRATVGTQHSQWNDAHTQIVTVTQLLVTTYLRGNGSDTLALRQLGGTVDGLRMEIPGDAHLTPGQDVVLFLRRGEGVVFLTAMAQSVYVVGPSPNGAPTVARDLTDVAIADLHTGAMTLHEAPHEPVETLDHLVADITAAPGAR